MGTTSNAAAFTTALSLRSISTWAQASLSRTRTCDSSLPGPSKHTSRISSTRPGQRASIAYQQDASPPSTTPSAESSNKHEHGVLVNRDQLITQTRKGRTCRLRRWASLEDLKTSGEDLGVDITAAQEERVNIWLVGQQVGENYRIRGRARTNVQRICDRCAKEIAAEADGRFEVFLVTTESGDEKGSEEGNEEGLADLAEAMEPFGSGVDSVDLSQHVRDAVVLGMPTRVLCSEDCQGVVLAEHSDMGSVRYGDSAVGMDAVEMDEVEMDVVERDVVEMDVVEGVGGERVVGDEQLLELKRRLEEGV